ncbi:unnamed protein product [Angiostrongylus costaricensis]|uniref:Cytochrome c oxidase assembly protein COX19 n=1 Tax=Angiostrongylus costaricensis TaxID=334426 RepID=A0A0R3PU83_ANGCS|nr:unnamed protein product [Angiostrongylus costaricensis]
MSQAGPFNRIQPVTPPLKGSFPLDHEGTCKVQMLKYMCCLYENKYMNSECREKAKSYFQCRMDHGLMDREEWEKLGYGVE